MSADVLREAARLMRHGALNATGGPWIQNGFEYDDEADTFTYDISSKSDPMPTLAYAGTRDDAEHIAAWHPAVALAVADLLDAKAAMHECAVSLGARGLADDDPAVIIARAYLGAQS